MNSIFHNMNGQFIEMYIDDIVVKSPSMFSHFGHFSMNFERIMKHQLKMNLFKYAFGIQVENFLRFLVHQKGTKIDRNKTKAIIEAQLPTIKKNLQRLLR